MTRLWIALVGALLSLAGGCANLDTGVILDTISESAKLDEATVASGLREALEVGSDRAVASGSTVDGFLGNVLIRIALPEQFEETAGLLRSAGFGRQVDEFELAMNRP